MISIREADEQDFPAICKLMKNELGYPGLEVCFIPETAETLADILKKTASIF